jgi:general secretion pathway protein B
MSYILDALRKADSDRERGAVPGIHTQPVPAIANSDDDPRAAPVLVWTLIGVSALLAALVGWLWLGRERSAEPPRPAAVAFAPAVATPPAPAPVASTAPAAKVEVPPVVSHAAPPAVRRPAPAEPARGPAVAKAAAKASGTDSRIYAVSELPESIRRELPQVAVGGSMYSEHPASRFLVINGQVFHEGEKLAPELWLDQIRLKAAVLRYKDYRYTLLF